MGETNGKTGITRLGEIWTRMDALCLKLWQEDRIAAVGLQALIEEYKEEIARAEQMLAALQRAVSEQRVTVEKSFAEQYNRDKSQWMERNASLERQVKSLDEALAQERLRSEDFRVKLEDMERQFIQFKDDALKRESQMDSMHSAHMRNLLDEVEKREAKLTEQETALRAKENDLRSRAEELETTYKNRLKEIEKLKDDLKGEISQIVRDYRSKQGGKPTPPGS